MAGQNQPIINIRRITGADFLHLRFALAELLKACVDGGASIGFIHPFAMEDALAYWDRISSDVAAGDRHMLVAEDVTAGVVAGTVQLVVNTMPNQRHRADVAKLMVLPDYRARGIAANLMAEVEAVALTCGRQLLVLDTVTNSSADRLYTRLGWQRVGTIPDYAYLPEGGLISTTFFFKKLNP